MKINSNYYYLVSTLPFLIFDKQSPITVDGFKDECKKWLNNNDYILLKKVKLNLFLDDKLDIWILKQWKLFNHNLKENIAKQRTCFKKQSINVGSIQYKEIFDEKNPLLMEKKIEIIRWNFIDDYESWYNFDINWLVLYYLKLQINERLYSFKKEEGTKKFKKLCEVNYD